MKVSFNEKHNEATFTIQSLNDIFHFYLILEEGDELYGWSYRQRKIYDSEGKSEKGERERVYLGIRVEKVYFNSKKDVKVIGSIIFRPEYFEASGHHSFTIGLGDTVKVIKKDWSSAIVQTILKNIKEEYPKSLIISLDYGSIAIAKLDQNGMSILFSEEENIGGKRDSSMRDETFNRFIQKCTNISKKFISEISPELVILYSPSNLKDILYENLKEDFEKIFRVRGSIGGLEGIYESLRNEDSLKILSLHGHDETASLEHLLSKPEKIAIGMEEVKKVVELRAIDKLLISTKLLKSSAQEELQELKKISEKVKRYGGSIKIIDEESDFGKTMEKLGNVLAILRFNLC